MLPGRPQKGLFSRRASAWLTAECQGHVLPGASRMVLAGLTPQAAVGEEQVPGEVPSLSPGLRELVRTAESGPPKPPRGNLHPSWIPAVPSRPGKLRPDVPLPSLCEARCGGDSV